MRFVINPKTFHTFFKEISSFTSVRDIKPVTTHVRCIANVDDGLMLEATNQETAIRYWLNEGVDVTENGETLLSPKILLRILSEIPKPPKDSEELNTVVIESNDAGLKIIGDKFRYNIPTMADYVFPEIPSFVSDSYHTIDVQSFIELLSRTKFSCDPQNAHYSLGGIMMNFQPSEIETVSTDGRRLSYLVRGIEENVGNFVLEGKTNIPSKAAFDFCRILTFLTKNPEITKLDVYSEAGQIFIRCGHTFITSTLLDGRYPAWQKIIPDTSDYKKAIISLATLGQGVNQASIIEDEKKPGVWLHFNNGTLTFNAAGESTGESSIEAPVIYEDEPVSVKFDSRFIKEFCNSIGGDVVTEFYVKSDERCMFKLPDRGVHVIMPLS